MALNRLVPHYAHLVRGDTNLDAPNASGSAPADPAATANPTDFHDASTKAQSTTVLAQRLVPGDLVLFSAGDRIPADIRITKCADLSIDESNLTGENEPVYKYSHTLEREDDARPFYDGAPERNLRLSEQHNVAFMGTLVRSGYGQGLVIATGPRTEFGSIHASLQDIESPRTPLQLSMDRLDLDKKAI
ncbi:High affinity Ca2+/Mn2+ P-type ATPase-like protein, partial [Ascosphaera atra]